MDDHQPNLPHRYHNPQQEAHHPHHHAADAPDTSSSSHPDQPHTTQPSVPPITPSTTRAAQPALPPHQIARQASTADIDIAAPSHRSRIRGVAGTLIAVALLFGLGTVWYQMNRNVYTLGLPNNTNQKPKATPTNKPQTLGAETHGIKTLQLNLNLKPLNQGHYQLWISQNNHTTALGSFNPTTAGQLTNLDGSPFAPTFNLEATNPTLLITIEAGQDSADTPSQTIILSGQINQNKANLKFSAVDLSHASGVFTLATPTDPGGSNQKSGLWFAHTDGQNLTSPGLNLPDAPAGWKYEGQAIYKDVAVEMGRFSKPNQADEFDTFTPNKDKVPSFPGEDFLQDPPGQLGLDFPTDLTTGEWQVAISLEPDQNGTDPTGTGTFFLVPLKASIPQGAQDHKEYPLTLDLKDFPSGTATLK